MRFVAGSLNGIAGFRNGSGIDGGYVLKNFIGIFGIGEPDRREIRYSRPAAAAAATAARPGTAPASAPQQGSRLAAKRTAGARRRPAATTAAPDSGTARIGVSGLGPQQNRRAPWRATVASRTGPAACSRNVLKGATPNRRDTPPATPRTAETARPETGEVAATVARREAGFGALAVPG